MIRPIIRPMIRPMLHPMMGGDAARRARLLLNKVPGASALYMPDRKLSSRIINGVRTLRTSNNDELDFSPAQIGRGELISFTGKENAVFPALAQTANSFVQGGIFGLVTYPTKTTGIADPFGGNNAVRLVWPDTTQRRFGVRATGQDGLIPAHTGDVTFSFWGRVASGSLTLRSVLRSEPTGDINNKDHNLTTDWQRFEHTHSRTAANGPTGFFFDRSAEATVEIYGLQMERASSAGELQITETGPSGDGRTPINYDWSGNGINATQTTVAAQPFIATAGVLEEGLRFASDQWLETGSETIGDGLFAGSDRRWTVSIWVKRASAGVGAILGRAILPSADRTFHLFYTTEAPEGLKINIRGAETIISSGFTAWSNLTISWDGAVGRFYINNTFNKNLNVGTAAENTGQKVTIGMRTSATTGFGWNGNIAFVGIWNRALTANERTIVKTLTDPTA